MEITKEQLQELRNNPFASLLANIYGYDLNELLKDAEKALKEEKAKETKKPNPTYHVGESLTDILDKMVADGKLVCEETKNDNGISTKYYKSAPKEEEEYVSPTAKTIEFDEPKQDYPNFTMSRAQFSKFVKDYRALADAVAKIDYLYGINLGEGGNGFSLCGKTQEIIWDLIRIIFGDDNTEDIADFIYGNSNFDSAEQLYDELT